MQAFSQKGTLQLFDLAALTKHQTSFMQSIWCDHVVVKSVVDKMLKDKKNTKIFLFEIDELVSVVC